MEKSEIRPPLPQKPLNRSSSKFAWVIMSGTRTPMQNFITIRLPAIAPPPICVNAHQVTPQVFWFFYQPTAKTPAPILRSIRQISFAQGCAFCGSRKQNCIFRPIPPPPPQKKRKFWANFRLDFLAQKGLNNGDAHL